MRVSYKIEVFLHFLTVIGFGKAFDVKNFRLFKKMHAIVVIQLAVNKIASSGGFGPLNWSFPL